ncbi:MAG: hypothetical protein V2A58_13565 [Planctomycetota bacterium]
MRHPLLHTLLVWTVFIGGTALVVVYHAQRSRRVGRPAPTQTQPARRPGAETIDIGGVELDSGRRTVRFEARVRKASGRVLFLASARGYRWVEDESAIVSDVRLADLQAALAALDWELWDFLWTGEAPPSGRRPSVDILLSWDNSSADARRLVNDGDSISPRELVFFGSPEFDPLVLSPTDEGLCDTCPLYDRERESFEKLSATSGGKEGYELATHLFPPVGTLVTITIHERLD